MSFSPAKSRRIGLCDSHVLATVLRNGGSELDYSQGQGDDEPRLVQEVDVHHSSRLITSVTCLVSWQRRGRRHRVSADTVSSSGVAGGLGCSSVGRASDRHAADTGSISGAARDFFFAQSTFCTDSLTLSVRTRQCAIPCILQLCAR